jgi:hypothetical protein
MNSEQTQSRTQEDASRHSETVLATVHGARGKEHVDSILTSFGLRAENAAGSDRLAVMSGNRHSEPEVDLDLVELALAKLEHAVPSMTVLDSKLQQP